MEPLSRSRQGPSSTQTTLKTGRKNCFAGHRKSCPRLLSRNSTSCFLRRIPRLLSTRVINTAGCSSRRQSTTLTRGMPTGCTSGIPELNNMYRTRTAVRFSPKRGRLSQTTSITSVSRESAIRTRCGILQRGCMQATCRQACYHSSSSNCSKHMPRSSETCSTCSRSRLHLTYRVRLEAFHRNTNPRLRRRIRT